MPKQMQSIGQEGINCVRITIEKEIFAIPKNMTRMALSKAAVRLPFLSMMRDVRRAMSAGRVSANKP